MLMLKLLMMMQSQPGMHQQQGGPQCSSVISKVSFCIKCTCSEYNAMLFRHQRAKVIHA